MASIYDLQNLRGRLDFYKEELRKAVDKGDEVEIRHWENNIRGLENEISGLEYELKNG